MNGWKWEYITTSTLFNIKTFFFVANPLMSSYLPIILNSLSYMTHLELWLLLKPKKKSQHKGYITAVRKSIHYTAQSKSWNKWANLGSSELSAGFELIIILFFFPWILTTSVGTWQHCEANVSVSLRDAPRDAGVCDCACNERAWDKDRLTENKYHY